MLSSFGMCIVACLARQDYPPVHKYSKIVVTLRLLLTGIEVE
jgi:hypothetical protein